MKIDIIAGARPNFIKIAPIIDELKARILSGKAISFRLVHTGQHYDNKMSTEFFSQLSIPEPDFNLGAGSGSPAEQTAAIMIGYENLLALEASQLCLVVGDVTSTMACAIVAKKANIPVAHIEAGLRSGDLSMPEEVNRIVTDSISDYFYTTTRDAGTYLTSIGVSRERVIFIGNTMIDSLKKNQHRLRPPREWTSIQQSAPYIVLTLHRPSNVDDESALLSRLQKICEICSDFQIVFPVHPRTRKNIPSTWNNPTNLMLLDALPYLEFNYLVKSASAVITDSGGITEECTFMGVPCMTLRSTTERPETIDIGSNVLVGVDPEALRPWLKLLKLGNWKKSKIPELWDGHSAKRFLDHVELAFDL